MFVLHLIMPHGAHGHSGHNHAGHIKEEHHLVKEESPRGWERKHIRALAPLIHNKKYNK